MEETERLVRIRTLARSGHARLMREAGGLGLREVAEAVGVGVATVSRWETGISAPRRAHALRWERFLATVARQVGEAWTERFPQHDTQEGDGDDDETS